MIWAAQRTGSGIEAFALGELRAAMRTTVAERVDRSATVAKQDNVLAQYSNSLRPTTKTPSGEHRIPVVSKAELRHAGRRIGIGLGPSFYRHRSFHRIWRPFAAAGLVPRHSAPVHMACQPRAVSGIENTPAGGREPEGPPQPTDPRGCMHKPAASGRAGWHASCEPRGHPGRGGKDHEQ
jgi:hypothetical protein